MIARTSSRTSGAIGANAPLRNIAELHISFCALHQGVRLVYLPTPAKHVCGAVALPDRLFCIARSESQSARAARTYWAPPPPPPAHDSMTAARSRAMTRAVTCWGRRHVRSHSTVPMCPRQPLQSPLVTRNYDAMIVTLPIKSILRQDFHIFFYCNMKKRTSRYY